MVAACSKTRLTPSVDYGVSLRSSWDRTGAGLGTGLTRGGYEPAGDADSAPLLEAESAVAVWCTGTVATVV